MFREPDHLFFGSTDWDTERVPVWESRGEDIPEERSGSLGVDSLGAGHGARTECSPVVSALEGDERFATGGLSSEFHGCFDGFGAGVPEEEGVKRRVGHGREETVDELQVGSVEGDGALEVDEVGDLRGSSLRDGRVAAAGQRGAIQITLKRTAWGPQIVCRLRMTTEPRTERLETALTGQGWSLQYQQ